MNPTQLAEFNEKRNALITEIADAHDKGDHTRWVEARIKLDNMDAEREKYDQQEQRNAYMTELEKRSRTPANPVAPPDRVAMETRGGADGNPLGTTEYRNAFWQFLTLGEKRNVSFVSGPAGQYALAPAAMDNVIVTPAGTASGLRAKIDLRLLPGTMTQEGLSITARSGGFSKGRSITLDSTAEASLTFAKRRLTLNPFVTHLRVDNPFLDNSALQQDAMAFIAEQLNALKEEGEENYIFYGTGDNEPLGILVNDAQGITSSKHIEAGGTGGALTLRQLVAMQYAVKAKWQGESEWYFSKDACVQIDSLVDSTGQPIVKESVSANGPVKTLLGRPLNMTEAITAAFTSATSGVFADDSLVGCYGSMKRYQAIQPRASAIKVDRSRLVEKDQTLVLCLNWFDGHPIDAEAFSVAKIVN